MQNYIDEDRLSLQMKNIHELRLIGKRTGVKASTALPKGVLIEEILKIRYGEVKPTNFETRGRPSKSVKEFEYKPFDGFSFTRVVAAAYKSKLNYNDDDCISGILELHKDGFGVLHQNLYAVGRDDIYVPVALVNGFKLREGDLVTVVASKQGINQNYIAQDIKKINGLDPDVAKARANFFDFVPRTAYSQFDLSKGKKYFGLLSMIYPLAKGAKSLIIGKSFSGKTKLCMDVADAIKKSNNNTFVLPVFLSKNFDEASDIISKNGPTTIVTTFDEEPEVNVRAVTLCLQRAMRQVEIGKDAVLIVDDLCAVKTAYEEMLKKAGKPPEMASYWIKSIFATGIATNGNGSLTFIGIVDNSIPVGEQIVSELYQISSASLYINNDLSDLGVFPPVDILVSKSRHDDQVLTEEEKIAGKIVKSSYSELKTVKQKCEFLSKFYNMSKDEIVKETIQGRN